MNGESANSRQVLCDIARSAFEVVNRLLDRDQLLARELRSDSTTSRQVYREECITVEMAATLRERFRDNVEITLFTPPEEAQTGADWYWRFERGNGAIHARVQAKRVQRTEFGQMDARGEVQIDLQQLEQLISATSDASNELSELQASLATFARFDANPPCGRTNLSRDCQRHSHERECSRQKPSLWIASREIQSLQSARCWSVKSWSTRYASTAFCRASTVQKKREGPRGRDSLSTLASWDIKNASLAFNPIQTYSRDSWVPCELRRRQNATTGPPNPRFRPEKVQ